ncbi:uncharacterized protein TEOVI_000570400 [Trypanosoma equiperdum]|uniref:Trypanosome variant surface glycoprotein (A-type) n=1 Tax=Trypanosoma equiperdum TaxID=5694 RepID=A0A1G4I4I5_TRYEQ|nr:hypothetical protein TEOVI_000570400 [Trypanosoma equiperdum]
MLTKGAVVFWSAIAAVQVLTVTTAVNDATNTLAHGSNSWCTESQHLEATIAAVSKEVSARRRTAAQDELTMRMWNVARNAAAAGSERAKFALLYLYGLGTAQRNRENAAPLEQEATAVSRLLAARLENYAAAQAAADFSQPVINAPETARGTVTSRA